LCAIETISFRRNPLIPQHESNGMGKIATMSADNYKLFDGFVDSFHGSDTMSYENCISGEFYAPKGVAEPVILQVLNLLNWRSALRMPRKGFNHSHSNRYFAK
jgi:hypothetical protein